MLNLFFKLRYLAKPSKLPIYFVISAFKDVKNSIPWVIPLHCDLVSKIYICMSKLTHPSVLT